MKKNIFLILCFLIGSRTIFAQDQEEMLENNPGVTFGLFAELGAVAEADHRVKAKLQLGYEFYPIKKMKKLAMELQIGFIKDNYADKNWLYIDNYFSYMIYTYYLTASPKLIYPLSKELALFVNNDFSIGLPTAGSLYFETKQNNSLKRTMPMFIYGVNAGVKLSGRPTTYFSVGYSTYNIHKLLIKNTPSKYSDKLPNLNSSIWVGINLFFGY